MERGCSSRICSYYSRHGRSVWSRSSSSVAGVDGGGGPGLGPCWLCVQAAPRRTACDYNPPSRPARVPGFRQSPVPGAVLCAAPVRVTLSPGCSVYNSTPTSPQHNSTRAVENLRQERQPLFSFPYSS